MWEDGLRTESRCAWQRVPIFRERVDALRRLPSDLIIWQRFSRSAAPAQAKGKREAGAIPKVGGLWTDCVREQFPLVTLVSDASAVDVVRTENKSNDERLVHRLKGCPHPHFKTLCKLLSTKNSVGYTSPLPAYAATLRCCDKFSLISTPHSTNRESGQRKRSVEVAACTSTSTCFKRYKYTDMDMKKHF